MKASKNAPAHQRTPARNLGPSRAPIPADLWIALALCGFLATQYLDVLRIPFMREDYLFLDFVRTARFTSWWAPNELIARYYRPWSREFHYGILERLFGPSELAFHVASLTLWALVLWLYFRLARRVTSTFPAAVATLGAVSMAAWGTPLLWVAGVQDLWMLAAAVVFLDAFVSGRRALACGALVIALLSKEPAAVLPGIAAAYVWILERRPLRVALARISLYAVVVGVWALFHPMLGGSLLHPGSPAPSQARLTTPLAIGAEVMSLFNLDVWPGPESGWGVALVAAIPLAAGFGAILYVLSRRPEAPPASAGAPTDGGDAWRAIAWGAAWALLGWLPLLAPGITWQPYYGLLGALGAWLSLAALIGRRWGPALGLIAVVVSLRSARVDTPGSEMGSEWSQRRIGALTREARESLLALHPTLPPGSRVFFGDVPWGLGFLGSHGGSPALRVWYRDGTLHGAFRSAYRARAPGESQGRDYFFLFERGGRLVEVVRGEEPLVPQAPPSPRWERDHYFLAKLLAGAGDARAAAEEWAKLATVFPRRTDYARELLLARRAASDTTRR